MHGSISVARGVGVVLAVVLSHAMPHAEAAPAVPRSRLITSTSIGPARLGMSVGALKRTFPGATVTLEEGPVSYFALKKNGREVLRFVTRQMMTENGGPISDRHTVYSLSTTDPLFKTAAGIGPGSWLHNAARLYGRPTLSFWSHGESAIFPRLSRQITFEVSAPGDPSSEYKVAGIYTRKELESLNGTTRRYRSGTRITSVGCALPIRY